MSAERHLSESAKMALSEAFQVGDELNLDLFYPRNGDEGRVSKLVIGLCDVRAADSIRISYDFDRDGWKIEQASRFEWVAEEGPEYDPDWQEVAFIQAWAREESEEDADARQQAAIAKATPKENA